MSVFVENRTLGRVYLTLLALFVVYYSLWVLALPFVSDSAPDWLLDLVRVLFPARASVALGIPALLGTVLLTSLLARAYYLVRQDRRLEAEQQKQQ